MEPGRGQTVRVAGVEIGKIAGVHLEDGVAVVELDIDTRYEDMVRDGRHRPAAPEDGAEGHVPRGRSRARPRAPGGRADRRGGQAPDVDPDEIFAALDADTRPYLTLLVSGAGKGLRGRGDDLNAALRRLEPLHRDLARVTRATARRRHALRRLVHSYGLLTAALGRHPGRAAAPRERVGRGVRRAGRRGAGHLHGHGAPAGGARAVRADARAGRRVRARAEAHARRAAPADPPARRDQRRGPALPARDHLDPPRSDPPVRPRRPSVDGRPAGGDGERREGGPRPDGLARPASTASSTSAPTTPAGRRGSPG